MLKINQDLTSGYINKEKILKYVTEGEIYELVFGFKPEEGDVACSPIRPDTNPGCWFAEYDGKLKFNDFASTQEVRGIIRTSFDCFDMVQFYFDLPNLYHTLLFIKEKLIVGKSLKEISKKVTKGKEKFETKIEFTSKLFNKRDNHYWSKYGISSKNLVDDKVFSVGKVIITSLKGRSIFPAENISYAFTDFVQDRVKIYFPHETGHRRFLTTCKNNDIGNLRNIELSGNQLVITKSYKDSRVLRNMGIKNVVWFQSENTFPNYDILYALCSRFKNIVVFFDNDVTGIEEGRRLNDIINQMFPNRSKQLWIPSQLHEKVKDPSDFYYYLGEEKLYKALNKQNLIDAPL